MDREPYEKPTVECVTVPELVEQLAEFGRSAALNVAAIENFVDQAKGQVLDASAAIDRLMHDLEEVRRAAKRLQAIRDVQAEAAAGG